MLDFSREAFVIGVKDKKGPKDKKVGQVIQRL